MKKVKQVECFTFFVLLEINLKNKYYVSLDSNGYDLSESEDIS